MKAKDTCQYDNKFLNFMLKQVDFDSPMLPKWFYETNSELFSGLQKINAKANDRYINKFAKRIISLLKKTKFQSAEL